MGWNNMGRLAIVCLELALIAGSSVSVEAQLRSGPTDQHKVDDAAADRGRLVWAAECIGCHGTYARGDDDGPNLIQSGLVLRDRYASEINPFLAKGHPMQSGKPSLGLTEAQVKDLAHFIHQRVFDTLRGSPIFEVQDVLTGDVKAGEAFFNGDGGCTKCHSASGDLADVGARHTPATLQTRFLFPQSRGRRRGRSFLDGPEPKKARVTVTPATGPAVSGELVHLDDFTVALRNEAGVYRSFKRTPDLKVVKEDPFAAHIALLDRITDQQMHDTVAYLETLR
jgi:mono/diheme cytochrome c family protein